MAMRILEFLNRVQSQLGYGPGALPNVPGLSDPLKTIVETVCNEAATPRARTLAKVVQAIHADAPNLIECEVFTLDRQALALVAALANDRVEGRYTPAEWTRAVKEIALAGK
jgi:hypothetical protein